ncbi:YceI family protein [Legionella longbeachae]|uniref:Polyprenyl-pyrophosphate binding protein n=1 Tax=Legionella longbeachae serogroup 1 (strain NSW150) TaxID=661367 RepID=D3HT59_LEGLN|nr:YceI family protein [Legionella longbeachae]VEE02593.1 polyprenyl-pyrophosphate binding protein [Legionella oakridgensis]HBD7397855.1 polyisoprenoid-binding protein [Legionella pneumophila]ARB91141.1 polyisoprenoid-binding protein [Legionella longbeachae]ARM32431.1 polyisoprenoid-binding protein [Legionella longbeachae]EEZ94760.1 YceI-like family protein [Legionella longbeachae D-4968]
MKQLLKYFSLFILFSISSFQVNAAPETFILDNKHTYVLWSIDHLGFSTQYGKWYATGKVTLDQDNPGQSKVDVKIDVADMITGIPELDEHLKSQLFFDTKKFPAATFVSNRVTPTGKETATVDGTLTLRGVSKPVVLQVTLTKKGMNPISNKMSVGFTATTSIKRSDFGINAFLPALSDTVNIKIGAEAYLDKKAG